MHATLTPPDTARPTVPAEPLCAWRLVQGEDDAFAQARAARLLLQRHQAEALPAAAQAWLALPMAGLLDALLRHADALDGDIVTAAAADASTTRFIALQHAPRGLLAGCLLQNVATAGNGHEPLALLAHRLHRWHLGGGAFEAQHGVLCRQWLLSLGLHLPETASDRWATLPELLPAAWDLPAYWLSLSLQPQACESELFGAALYELAAPLPVELRGWPCVAGSAAARYVEARQAGGRGALLADAVQALAGAALDKAGLLRGFMTSLRLAHAWSAELQRHAGGGQLDPAGEMLRLVQRKARFAVGYHGRLSLGKTPFDEAIAGDPAAFVERLSKSPWIAPGRPDDSLLLSRQVKFGGPMFRVFSDAEIEVLRRWIASLGDTRKAWAPTPAPANPAPRATPTASMVPTVAVPGVRELYFQLLNLESHPAARPAALAHARDWLACSARALATRDDLPPKGPQGLRTWFEQRAQEQVRSYGGQVAISGKSRDEVIDEALQLSPMILVDGAWFQRFGNAGLVDSPIGALLYQTYSDEIGNGQAALNHPNIYRALIQQMGIRLPATTSRAFAEFGRFDTESFEVPAFWLSVSLHTRRFLPELLGLNLAMELSGVGGAYRSARDELRLHGFSTLFVDLHNTIDNVSTGHSAMALEAIEMHLDDLSRHAGADATARTWQRVRTGFAALTPPPRRWADRIAPPRYPH